MEFFSNFSFFLLPQLEPRLAVATKFIMLVIIRRERHKICNVITAIIFTDVIFDDINHIIDYRYG